MVKAGTIKLMSRNISPHRSRLKVNKKTLLTIAYLKWFKRRANSRPPNRLTPIHLPQIEIASRGTDL